MKWQSSVLHCTSTEYPNNMKELIGLESINRLDYEPARMVTGLWQLLKKKLIYLCGIPVSG